MNRNRHRACLLVLLLALGTQGPLAHSAPIDELRSTSTTRPIPPEYRLHDDGSVTLRLCYNWSCATRESVLFTAEDMAAVREQLAQCTGDTQHERLQRLRIGVWMMEELAERYQPLLANDTAMNDDDREYPGRTDCIDNSTNTTTYLQILRDLGEIPEWSITTPEVRNLLRFDLVHWTAVVADERDGGLWSVDSWFRPNGHLPFVMPLADWVDEKQGWAPPYDRLNPYPDYSSELCGKTTTAARSTATGITR